MAFKDWEAFNADRIKLPIGGKEYELPEISAKLGHALRLAQAGKPVPMFDGLTPEQEAELFLGPKLYRRMVADNVPDAAIARAVIVMMTDWKIGRDAAEAAWEAGIDPEAFAANLAARLQTESTSTDEGSTTPSPASTSGTSSPKTTRRAKPRGKAPAKVAASPGSTSPSSGT